MRDAGVHRYDEIELRYQGRRIGKVIKLLTEPEHVATRERLRVTGADFLLQAHKGRIDLQKRQEVVQPHRPLPIPDMLRIASPGEPDLRRALGPVQRAPIFPGSLWDA